jgi:hypothetical protein
VDGSGVDDRTLTRAERSRVTFWLLVVATTLLGIYGCTRLVPFPSHPKSPERAVVRRSGDLVSVAMSACRGKMHANRLDVLLAASGSPESEWQLVYSAAPDGAGWLYLPDEIVRQVAGAAASSGGDSLVLRTTLQGASGSAFEGVGSVKLAALSVRLEGEGDWVLNGKSTVPVVPTDICHA